MSMQRMDLFTLILVGSVYQTAAASKFYVSINASTNSIKQGENFSIDCSIFGLSIVEYLNSEIELLLRKNNSIIQTVRVIKGQLHGENDKYGWTEDFHKVNTCEIISVRFDVFNASFSDEGIYSFYTTNNSVTQYDSINLYSGNKTENLANYVVVRHIQTLDSSISYFCCKYGFSVLENESLVNFVNLRPNESARFAVFPTFDINNNSIAIVKPWISYEGCYNLTVDKSPEMDCTKISAIEWTTKKDSLPLIGIKRKRSCVLLDQNTKETAKHVSNSYCLENENTESENYIELFSIIENRPTFLEEVSTSCKAAYTVKEANASRLYGIPCYNSTTQCDAYCLEEDGSNATYHGNLSWSEAMDICISLNKSLPGINSDFLRTSFDKENKSVCLAAYQSSSIVFQPVIKQVMNEDGNITVILSNTSLSLPFICGANSDPEKSNYCDGTTQAVITNSSVFTTPNYSVNQEVSSNNHNDSTLIIIITLSAVEFLLIVVAVVSAIHRFHGKYGSQRNGNVSVINHEYIYSHPNETQEAATAIFRRGLDNNFINRTEAHSDLHSNDGNELIETHLNNEYRLTDKNGEYDVLRSKRENLEISLDGNIYDRTNNLVSGIYDSTKSARRIHCKE